MVFLMMDLALAWAIDRILGDPQGWPHPVNAIGRLIGRLDKAWYPGPAASSHRAFLLGLALTTTVVALSLVVPAGLIFLASMIHPWAVNGVLVYLLYAALAGRCLEVEARKVHRALGNDQTPLEAARQALSLLVSRDTTSLDRAAVVRATVETVAENTVDGVLSPLFWAFVGLALGMTAGWGVAETAALTAGLVWAFKAVSTLDTRVGYKTERYLYFGRASARLDDALNCIPARLSLFFLPLAALLAGLDFHASFVVGWRDRLKHQSPNSAHPEAGFAGALGIQLGGGAVYHGQWEDKPTLGDDLKPPSQQDIRRATGLMHLTSFLFLAVGLALLSLGVF